MVRGRPPGQTPLVALRRHFLGRLDERDAASGLCDLPGVVAFHRLVYGTPSLSSHLLDFLAADTEALAGALAEPPAGSTAGAPGVTDALTARLVAAQYVAVRQVLAHANWSRIAAGSSADEAAPAALADARTAFDLLAHGAAARGC